MKTLFSFLTHEAPDPVLPGREEKASRRPVENNCAGFRRERKRASRFRLTASQKSPGLGASPTVDECKKLLAVKKYHGFTRGYLRQILFFSVFGGYFFPKPVAAVEPEGLRDVKPPVFLAADFPTVLAGLLVLLALAVGLGLFWFFRQRRKRKAQKDMAPQLPPWDLAMKLLEELRAENLPSAGKVKEYYSRLSDIIRHYLEGRFSINAPEMTTEEFLLRLRNSAVLNGTQKESLKNFLTCCDMAKFARYQSSPEQMDESWEFARRLVAQTRPDVPPIMPDVPAGNAPAGVFPVVRPAPTGELPDKPKEL